MKTLSTEDLIASAKLGKHRSGCFVREGKLVYQMRYGYDLDKKMDKLLNALTDAELVELVESWIKFKKNVLVSVPKIDFTNSDEMLESITKYQAILDKWRTPIIKLVYQISEDEFPFTDHKDSRVNDLIMSGVQIQLERRNLRKLFGKVAEQLYPDAFSTEVKKRK